MYEAYLKFGKYTKNSVDRNGKDFVRKATSLKSKMSQSPFAAQTVG